MPIPPTLPDPLPIVPFKKKDSAEPLVARVPGSKSITNRALILTALAAGTTTLTGALFSRDTRIMVAALRELGFNIETDEPACTIRIQGMGGAIPRARAKLDFGNSGTTARFLTAMLALHPDGEYALDGDPALRARPMSGLLEALVAQGATATAPDGNPATHFPFTLRTQGLNGCVITVDASASSQILSALLMVAPLAKERVRVELEGKTVSEPFVEMTKAMMGEFGAHISDAFDERGKSAYEIEVNADGYSLEPLYQNLYPIEPDATAASYFLALPVVAPISVQVESIYHLLQGDIAFTDVLKDIGVSCSFAFLPSKRATVLRVPTWTSTPPAANAECEAPVISVVRDSFPRYEETRALRNHQETVPVPQGGDFDFNAISDTFLTLAALAPLLSGPLTIHGVAHARKQETDRVLAAAIELERLGQRVEPTAAELRANPGIGDFTIHPDRESMRRLTAERPVSIHTYEDHRMAMSFAILGCHDLHGDGRPWLAIKDPTCCGKTFPGFFAELERLRTA